jgi:CheY-like chemotaxis protein
MLLERLDALDGLRRPAEQIHRSAKRGADLTRQLLAFSRRQRLAPEVLDLNTLVREMEDLLHRLVGEDIELACELAPGEHWIRVDPGQLEQVIMNLVVNAFDATPAGGRITLSTATLPPADGARKHTSPRVLLEVRDTGHGIEPDVRPRIFEPFFTTKPKGKGTGLGLSTVYGIVKQSGGDLTVESEPGEGACFRITLPSAEAGSRSRPAPAPVAPPEAGSEWVLVVEDDTVFLDLLTEILRRKGYRVLAARDGEQAITLSRQHDSAMDLLLSDMVMPGITGADLAEKLRTRHPRLRVLLMSGYTEDALEDRNATAPGFAFIQKPFATADLLRRIRRLLDEERPEEAEDSRADS